MFLERPASLELLITMQNHGFSCLSINHICNFVIKAFFVIHFVQVASHENAISGLHHDFIYTNQNLNYYKFETRSITDIKANQCYMLNKSSTLSTNLQLSQ